jgi:MFS family permease
LRNRNFRYYLTGQGLSQTGMWFQLTAEMWVIVEITGSGKALGLHSVLRFGPLLLFGIPGSLFSGRFSRRKFLISTQSVYCVAALTLAIVAFTTSVTLPLIYTMVFVQGLVNAIDNPVRRSFIRDMVTDDELSNALSLNSSMEVLTRTVGPAIAGVLIVTLGVPWCFALNAVSYAAVLTSLFVMDRTRLRPVHRLTREPGQLREGFRYAWSNTRIRRTLLMSTTVFLFAWNWQVVLPVYSSEELDGNASIYGLLVGLLGVGAFIGTLVVARVKAITGRFFRIVCAMLSASLLITAIAPSLPFAIAGLALLGASGTAFQIGAQTRLQLESDDMMIGRILALYAVCSVGAKPFSGLLAGTILDAASPRAAFGVGAVAVGLLFTGLTLGRASRSSPQRQVDKRLIVTDDDVTAGDLLDSPSTTGHPS